jgi:uncharacterized SAM-binding protein YcdF (DUF218 family)
VRTEFDRDRRVAVESWEGKMLEALWWLLQPSSLLLALLLLAFVALQLGWRSGAQTLLGLALLGLLAAATLPLASLLAEPLETRIPAPTALPADIDGVLVLGGAVDWRSVEAHGQLALDGAGERMLAAAALAQRYPGATLAFTGLFAEQVPADLRPDAQSQSLLFGEAFRGRERIFLGEARSTYEEALLALERLDPQPGERWMLVTSALHMPRALSVFATLGWALEPYPVDYRSVPGLQLRLRPDVAAELAELDRVVREWGALWVYRRSGRIVD